jgi:hypothetical protein
MVLFINNHKYGKHRLSNLPGSKTDLKKLTKLLLTTRFKEAHDTDEWRVLKNENLEFIKFGVKSFSD